MRVSLLHPRRDVTLPVKYAPDVDAIIALNVENQMRVARKRPEPQSWQAQIMGVAQRTAGGMATKVVIGLLQGFDETERSLPGALIQVALDCRIHIPHRQLARNHRLGQISAGNAYAAILPGNYPN